jgi:hypothetical protein
MADDKHFGADDFDGDAVHDDAEQKAVGIDGHGAAFDGYDAALDDATAGQVDPTGAGVDADPVAEELSAVFAAALADEPPSRVTAESVLREVRCEKSRARSGFGAWLASGPLSLKWAGGLVAAAALIGAVIVVSPNMAGSGADSAGLASSAWPESAVDGGGSESSSAERSVAAQDSAADDAAGMAAPEAAPLSGMSEMSASSESSQASASGEAYSERSDRAGGDAAVSDFGGAADGAGQTGSDRAPMESSSEAPSAGETTPESSSGRDCSLGPLEPEEWAAAVAALPSDVATTRLAGSSCAAGALRGNGIEILRGGELSGTYLWIVVTPEPIGRDGAATDSIVVSASRGDKTVTVIANQGADPWLDEAALQGVVDAVAATGN